MFIINLYLLQNLVTKLKSCVLKLFCKEIMNTLTESNLISLYNKTLVEWDLMI